MNRTGTILLVDDEAGFRENVAERLGARGFDVLQAGDGTAALALARERFVEVALVDVVMPDVNGLDLLQRLKEIDPLLEVVVVTGQASIETAVEAMRRGAYHYVTKPVRLAELEMAVRRAMERARLARENRRYREYQQLRRSGGASEFVASSPASRKLVEQAALIADADTPILIEGETGTGKEVLAEYIHRRSARRDRPFVVINCGALAESIVDAELFGHEKGAFTGAAEARPGLVEIADGGTLLLDEIADMSPTGQVRLLRFLERGVFRRVGSAREQSVDVRVLAATHRDLAGTVSEGKFREDLYHRLLVVRLAIPPLRERAEDIPPLAEHFLAGLQSRGCARALSAEALAALREYSWPGNVRELAHAIERACVFARIAGSEAIRPEHLGLSSARPAQDVLVSLEEAERRHVRTVLERVGGNRARAAEVLGVSERHLYRLLQKDQVPTDGGVRTD